MPCLRSPSTRHVSTSPAQRQPPSRRLPPRSRSSSLLLPPSSCSSTSTPLPTPSLSLPPRPSQTWPLPLSRPPSWLPLMFQALYSLPFSLPRPYFSHQVRLWNTLDSSLVSSFGNYSQSVDSCLFLPTNDIVIASSKNFVDYWNIDNSKLFSLVHPDVVQSISVRDNASALLSASKDNKLRIFDPRSSLDSLLVCFFSSSQSRFSYRLLNAICYTFQTATCHTGIKPTKAIWLGNKDQVFSTGFSTRREREYALWDIRKFNDPVVCNRIDTSPGIIIPLYDPDTGMLFLAGKGDSILRWIEISDANVTDGVLSYSSQSTFSCATLLPKRALNIMKGEVNRLLLASSDGALISPVSVVVPRRTYVDFHPDLFPDTRGDTPGLNAEQWLSGESILPQTISLDPKKAAKKSSLPHQTTSTNPPTVSSPFSTTTTSLTSTQTHLPKITQTTSTAPLKLNPAPLVQATRTTRTEAALFLPKQSSYRFLNTKITQKYDAVNSVSISHPFESEILDASEKFIAFAASGPGGRVAVLDSKSSGRLPAVIPCIVCGSDVTDFKFDPFNSSKLLTGSDDGNVRIWNIPDSGFGNGQLQSISFSAHNAKISLLVFHPSIQDLLLTASPGISAPVITLWNLITYKPILSIPHPDIVLAAAFDIKGKNVASYSRDKKLRVHDIKTGERTAEFPGHEGIKACRLIWLNDTHIASIGYGRGSTREIIVYDTKSKTQPQPTELDSATTILSSWHDADAGLLYIHGRGDPHIYIYQYNHDVPSHPIQLTLSSRLTLATSAQAMWFAPKSRLDVMRVEVARAWRLTPVTIEEVSFVVPRVRNEFVQDDLFMCDTWDVAFPGVGVAEWLGGMEVINRRIKLWPEGVELLSNAPPLETRGSKAMLVAEVNLDEYEQKRDLISDMFSKAQLDSDSEDNAGDESDEWK
ncbi:hypothetical protein HK096_003211 [Nowakowskiella sp. JEL0078]|nr:hypothetical protein HK096_003211 [Nowakowskiella sp. JEL0078]